MTTPRAPYLAALSLAVSPRVQLAKPGAKDRIAVTGSTVSVGLAG